MAQKRYRNFFLQGPAVVAAVHTLAGARKAAALKPGSIDLLEARVDAFYPHHHFLERSLPHWQLPVLLTVRSRKEGGCAALSAAVRMDLYRSLLPHAALIDIELSSLHQLQPLISEAKDQGVGLVTSYHNFKTTPSLEKLRILSLQARKAGADVLKIAALTSSPAHLATLLTFMNGEKRLRLSIMGMGPLGQVSRLLFAQCGSALNYGFLHEPQVPGQWPAEILKKRLQELRG